MTDSGVQPWSLPGSNIRALKRPWTGIAIRVDGSTFLIHDVCTSRNDATPALKQQAQEMGGRLIAAINGGLEDRILNMNWPAARDAPSTAQRKRLAIYIPDRDRYDNPVPNITRWTDEAIILLTGIGGGATSVPAEGAWIVKEHLIREKVHIVYSDVLPEAMNAHRAKVIDFLERFGAATGQDTVAAEYDGQMHFTPIKRPTASKTA